MVLAALPMAPRFLRLQPQIFALLARLRLSLALVLGPGHVLVWVEVPRLFAEPTRPISLVERRPFLDPMETLILMARSLALMATAGWTEIWEPQEWQLPKLMPVLMVGIINGVEARMGIRFQRTELPAPLALWIYLDIQILFLILLS